MSFASAHEFVSTFVGLGYPHVVHGENRHDGGGEGDGGDAFLSPV